MLCSNVLGMGMGFDMAMGFRIDTKSVVFKYH